MFTEIWKGTLLSLDCMPGLRDFVVDLIENPDPESTIGILLAQLSSLSTEEKLGTLVKSGRNALIFSGENRVIGGIVFQVKDGGFHVFTLSLNEDWQTRGYGKAMLMSCLQYSRTIGRCFRLRFSLGNQAGTAPASARFRREYFTKIALPWMERNAATLGIASVNTEEGWVILTP